MHPHSVLLLFLPWLLPVQARPISNPIPKDPPTAQVSRDPNNGVPWPVFWLTSIPIAGWTIRQAYRHRTRRHPGPWDHYESVEEVHEELADSSQQYQDLTRQCVNDKFNEAFPRRGFTLESAFNGQMSIAQHQKALLIVRECVGKTNGIIANNRRAERLDRTTGNIGSNPDAQNQQEDSNPSGSGDKGINSEDSNQYFGFMSRIGRILKAAEKVVPGGNKSQGKPLVPGSPPVGVKGFVF